MKETSKESLAIPRDETELLLRARALEGRAVNSVSADAPGLRTKGKVGEAIERVLGANGGAGATLDFPHLGIELKTIPVTPLGKPRESTFVCAVQLADADRAEWETSWVKTKLSRVLWIPIVRDDTKSEPFDLTIGRAMLWSPSPEQTCIMQADFDEILGTVAIGGIEGVTAHMGRWLQLRPKAADSHARTMALGPDQSLLATVPRGFYLRARFTEAILRDPLAIP